MPDIFTGLRRASPSNPHSATTALPTTRRSAFAERVSPTEGPLTRRLFSSNSATPAAATPPAVAPQKPKTSVMRAAPRPNMGGTMQRAGGMPLQVPASPAADPDMNSGGTITRDLAPGVTATSIYQPTPRATPTAALPATPTTSDTPQTESNNPLIGDTNRAPDDDTTSINPAAAAGFSQRGGGVPAGADSVGGTGIFARKFSSPKSASIYDSYVKRLFPSQPA